MKGVDIFRAGLQDISDLRKIEIACELSPWTVTGYESELLRPDSAAFIAAKANRELVGFIIGRIPQASGGAAEIYNIGILPNFRRQGIGKVLLTEFVDTCLGVGVPEVWLEARISNHEAIKFYQLNGFETNGTRPNFYQNPREDAQLMTLKLVHGQPLTKS